MVDTNELKHYWKLSKSTFYLTITVALLCVVFDPTMGIVFGCAVGLLQNAQQQSNGHNVTTIGGNKTDAQEDNDRAAQIGGEEPPAHDASFNEKVSYSLESLFCDPGMEISLWCRSSLMI
jgi:MFS superfamily sulfate permease-like transporter